MTFWQNTQKEKFSLSKTESTKTIKEQKNKIIKDGNKNYKWQKTEQKQMMLEK